MNCWRKKLESELARYDRLAIAFSGGCDSALLAAAALRQLGGDNVLLLLADSELLPRVESERARRLAEGFGLRLEVVRLDPLSDPAVRENGPQRCYHCKKRLFAALQERARVLGFPRLADGANRDDRGDYRPGARAAGRAAARRSARRSHAAFLALGEDACAAAWEMDTVEGAREDSACLLTLLHRPSRLQLALPLEEKTAGCVADALGGVRAILGADGTRRVFRAVLTDNGAEFSDEAAIAALLGEGPGETRLFYCDPRRSDQKGACERNHVEIRKLLPKGAGIRFDRLVPADLALAMSHVNSEPRGALGFATPARAFRAMLGEDAAALLDAYGVGDVPIGELDLTPGLIERARAERGDAPLA